LTPGSSSPCRFPCPSCLALCLLSTAGRRVLNPSPPRLAGRDLLGLLDGLVADELGHLEHVHVEVDERQRRERLQVVAVEREHGAQVADRLADVLLLVLGRPGPAGLVAQDLGEVVARLDRVQRVDLDRRG
jgi:hypothetical protein